MTDQMFDYIVNTFAQDQRDLLEKMKSRAEEAGIRMIMISEVQAKLLDMLVRLSGAHHCLEVGMLFGYSAAVMARALPENGSVTTIETDPEAIEVAQKNFEQLGIESKINIVEGKGLEQMKKMEEKQFEFILVDADKQNYPNYLEESTRLLKDGGVFLADNALAHGRVADSDVTEGDDGYETTAAIRACNSALAEHPQMDSTLIPVGDGFAFGIYREA